MWTILLISLLNLYPLEYASNSKFENIYGLECTIFEIWLVKPYWLRTFWPITIDGLGFLKERSVSIPMNEEKERSNQFLFGR